MSGTDIGHAAILLRTRYAMSGTDLGYGATRSRKSQRFTSRMVPLRSVSTGLPAYALAMRCPDEKEDEAEAGSIRLSSYAFLPDTVSCYAFPTRCPVLVHAIYRYQILYPPSFPYAILSTSTGYIPPPDAVSCYAVPTLSGTDIGYAATRSEVYESCLAYASTGHRVANA
eukprot:3618292-Rhodomonas_salina.2